LINILHITPDFNYNCGRSCYVYKLLKIFKSKGYNISLITNDGDSLKRVQELDIPIYKLDISSENKSLVHFLKQSFELKNIITKLNISIIHTHHRYSELISVFSKYLYRNSRRIKTITTALSLVNKRYYFDYRSDKIIAISKVVKSHLIKYFKINPDRISVIHNFIESNNYIHDSVKRKNNTFVILSVGRFHYEKNFELLFNALVKLNTENIVLILIGDGIEKEKYLKIIKGSNLNVTIIKPTRNLENYFKMADICILPSRVDPFPTFMLESGYYCKPFIGSDVDGISELIVNGKNGLKFKSKNVLDLVEKIKLFMENKKLADICAYNLNKEVLNNYSDKQIIPKIIKLYDELFI